ncbi:unnamed protein product [Gongylonema pulchrum]|uniref:Protein quiver n=1 Tax=Gongylonema pulchrum TaxID=637853 RepID=A0A183EBI1_9BILA|nr:unnamed protein product [Gongylonema pulchrum]
MAVSTARTAMCHAVTSEQSPHLHLAPAASVGPNWTNSFATILILLHLIRNCWALTCMTCASRTATRQDVTQLDKFRVTAQLLHPSCQMEPIRCDRDQDVCVTITMHINGAHYWIGAGCDRHEHFQHIACENVRTLTRNVQLGMVHERRALQRVCVCTFDKCNIATAAYFTTLPYLITILCSLLLHICNSVT